MNLSERAQKAFVNLNAADGFDRLLAWHRLTQEGYAVSESIDRFVSFRLTEEGRRIRENLERRILQ